MSLAYKLLLLDRQFYIIKLLNQTLNLIQQSSDYLISFDNGKISQYTDVIKRHILQINRKKIRGSEMIKQFKKFSLLLILLIILGTFSGIYAIDPTGDNNKIFDISKVSKTITKLQVKPSM